MTLKISHDQLSSLVHRLIHLSAWLIFTIFHIGLLAILITALYLSGLTGSDIYNYILPLAKSIGLDSTGPILSFFGISGFAIVTAYVLLIKKFFVKYTLDYVFKSIEKHEIQ